MKTFVAHDITGSRDDRNNVRNKMLYFKKANFNLGNDKDMFNVNSQFIGVSPERPASKIANSQTNITSMKDIHTKSSLPLQHNDAGKGQRDIRFKSVNHSNADKIKNINEEYMNLKREESKNL